MPCKIYEKRPQVCKDFPENGDDLTDICTAHKGDCEPKKCKDACCRLGMMFAGTYYPDDCFFLED
jgi:hypothetical protein